MCRSESRLFCCPGGGCDIRTSLHPPGSAARRAGMPPWSETRALWEGVSGWDGKQRKEGQSTGADRQRQHVQEEGLSGREHKLLV